MLCVANVFISLSDETGDGVDSVGQTLYFFRRLFLEEKE